MAQLLILADDFTGAMDTGVQFAKLGVKTLVGKDIASMLSSAQEAAVLVVDTQSRHLAPEQAYDTVFHHAQLGRRAGIPLLFKKTDSALRGNVGAELAAATLAWGADCMPFVPAYPQIGRITQAGIHYIGDVPVSQSTFGSDPFSPVLDSDVVRLLARQSSVPVVMAGRPQPDPPFIQVYDAQTEMDLNEIARTLRSTGKLSAVAGCAGLASVLPHVLGLPENAVETIRSNGRFLVLCGSIHPVTQAQIRYAIAHGARYVRLTPEQKLGLVGDSPEHEALLASLQSLCLEGAPVIVDANDAHAETVPFASSLGMTLPDIRIAISQTVGRLGKELLCAGVDNTLLLTGGDTLAGFLDACGQGSIRPLCELAPGVVRAVFETDGKKHDIITKSGGFGEEDLLWQLSRQMKNEKEV